MNNKHIRLNTKFPNLRNERLAKQSYENRSYYDSRCSNMIELENSKIQQEAKELIAKTRQMMEDLDMNKVPEKNERENKFNRSQSPASPREQLSLSAMHKSLERSTSRELKAVTNNHDVLLTNHLGFKVKDLTARLIEKTKTIKELEKELKTKTININKMQDALDKKNEEISQLNEALMRERSNAIKVSALERQIETQEKVIDDNKKKFDSILNEYKQKILDSIKLNNSSCEKIKELEEEKSFLREKSEKMSHSLKTCQSECNQLRQDVHLNIETKAKYESENETLKKKLSKLIDKIKNLHQSEDQRYGQTDYLTKKLAYFYEELKLNRQYYPSCHSSNPSLFSNY